MCTITRVILMDASGAAGRILAVDAHSRHPRGMCVATVKDASIADPMPRAADAYSLSLSFTNIDE